MSLRVRLILFLLAGSSAALVSCTSVSTPPAASVTAAAASRPGDIAPAQPQIPNRTFSVKDFGAVGDGQTPNTEAFKRAVAAVDKAGGGRLVVPAGNYATGPIDLCSTIDFHLDGGATIFFSPKFEDYGTSPRYRPLLLTTNAHDVKISGAGTINGHGEAWWTAAEEFKREANARKARSNTMPRPNMVSFDRCERVRVEGVTLTASPKFNLVPARCTDVTIDGITILNPHLQSPNTDGIDPSLCHRVLITRCLIDTDDDCIAIKSGGASGTAGVSDILITDCTFKHGHGCSFGSETNGGDERVTVRNCTFDGTDIGVRFKSDRTRGGLVQDIVYENLTMKNVGQAIVITSYYPDRDIPKVGQHVEAKAVGPTTPHWSKITIRNITATGCTKSAGMILGLPESLATDITLDNVTIDAPAGLRIGYAKGVTLKNVKVNAAQGEPLIIEDTVEGLKRVE
jgi:polygalacturonase